MNARLEMRHIEKLLIFLFVPQKSIISDVKRVVESFDLFLMHTHTHTQMNNDTSVRRGQDCKTHTHVFHLPHRHCMDRWDLDT